MIETSRTILRPIKLKDNKQLFGYRSDAMANQYQSWIPKNLEEVNDFILKNPREFNLADTWFQLAIIEKNTTTLLGDIGIHFFGSENLQCEIGFTLDKHQQGKGFATETVKATIDYLFLELNKHRVSTSIDPDNERSIALVKRLGLRKEGHFKQSYRMNDQWCDDVIYAVLKSEWLSSSKM